MRWNPVCSRKLVSPKISALIREFIHSWVWCNTTFSHRQPASCGHVFRRKPFTTPPAVSRHVAVSLSLCLVPRFDISLCELVAPRISFICLGMADEGCGLLPYVLSFVTVHHRGDRKFSWIDLQPRNIWADQPAGILLFFSFEVLVCPYRKDPWLYEALRNSELISPRLWRIIAGIENRAFVSIPKKCFLQ